MKLRIGSNTVQVLVFNTVIAKSLGLMFQYNQDAFFVFGKPVNYAIHTWFCFQQLHLLFLDHNMRVIEQTHLNPWQIYKPINTYHYLVELTTRIPIKKNQQIRMKKMERHF
ncbi:MAG: hypothetical protein AABX52_01530 [Nanoarchaeota archaeon]